MRNLVHAAFACGALALSLGSAIAGAQETVAVSDAEITNRWFVELSGAPTADGNSLANVRAEKNAFKKAAAAAKVSYTERRSFDVLFNGYSVEVDATNRLKLARVTGVKALWPVFTVDAPTPPTAGGSAPDLATAIAMTGADIAQNSLGLDGGGVKVAVMDTGIDIDHPDFGGNGAPTAATLFPTPRRRGLGFRRRRVQCRPARARTTRTSPDADPDDCDGHGTHVAGIVGANGDRDGRRAGVTFGAYRVFGCEGSTTADIMIAAMERALADGMDVLNMSIGSSFQWPQYPTAAAATRLVNQGVVVVASIGNERRRPVCTPPARRASATRSSASRRSTTRMSALPAFTITPDDTKIGYNAATGAPPAPTSRHFADGAHRHALDRRRCLRRRCRPAAWPASRADPPRHLRLPR